MLRFLYGTDFHGNETKFEAILDTAIQRKIDLIHLGADILPKMRQIYKTQKEFVENYLKNFIKRCEDKGIKVLMSFGNDDLYIYKSLYRSYGNLLDEVPYNKGGYEFFAYNYVPIYPFSLRTACKIDYPGWVYDDRPCETLETGEYSLYAVEDPETYFKEKGTIQEDLRYFKGGDKVVFACHCPPSGVNLDVCMDKRQVGSKALYDWIEEKQPAVVLCGHIHENYRVTQEYMAKIGKTTIIQPGQHLIATYMADVFIHDTVEVEHISV